MRLLVDAQCVQSSSSLRGIGRYTLCLLRGLVQEAGEHQVEVLLNGGDDSKRLLRARAALESFLPPRAIHVFDAPWPWHGVMTDARRRTAEACYAAAVESLQPDALLVGSVIEGDGENVLGLRDLDVPTAALLYDLIPAADPSTYLLGPGADVYWRRFALYREVDLLLSISDYSAGQARTLLGQGCPPLATVLGGPYPSGDFPAFETQVDEHPELVLPERFLLAVGGDHPRKNLDRLVQAWARVPACLRRGTGLVIACGLTAGTVRRLERIARQAGLADVDLVLTGRASERRLAELYERALAFVFPSTEEGLGMPPIEAMAAGCPTVLARSSSLVELADDPAAFTDGRSVKDMARALERLLVDDAHRERLRAVAANSSARLTWHASARRAWQALEGIPGSERRPAPAQDLPRALPRAIPSASPLPVRTDEPGLRVALAGVPAMVADADLASRVVRAGALDTALVAEDDVGRVAEHDVLAALRPLLQSPEEDLVPAVARPVRWALERPRPVWLLLSDYPDQGSGAFDGTALQQEADRLGAELVLARPGAEALARSADVVLVDRTQGEGAHLDLLASARCRGAVVVVLGGEAPDWCVAQPAGTWPEVLAALVAHGRNTGWPWRPRP